MKKIVCLLNFIFSLSVFAQEEERGKAVERIETEEPVVEENFIDQQAAFEGGVENFLRKVNQLYSFENVSVASIEELNRLGRKYFYVKFIIDQEGNPVDITTDDLPAGNDLFQEAKKVITQLKWMPAKRKEQAVKQQIVLPIVINLEE